MRDNGVREADSMGAIPREAIERFVYVVGTARGGTTIVHRSLGIHDEILTFPGPTHFMNHVWRYRSKIHNRLFVEIFRLPTFFNDGKVLKDLGEGGLNFLARYIKKCLASRDMQLMWQLYPLVYTLEKASTKEFGNIKCWIDKATSTYGIDTIKKRWPEVKLLFVARDPRAAVTSLAQRATAQSSGAYPDKIDHFQLINAALHWRKTMQHALFYLKSNSETSLVLYFEDLINSPASTLNEVYSFLGVRAMKETDILSRLSILPYKKTNHYVPVFEGSGLSREPLERWKTTLSEGEANLIWTITRRTAKKLGYSSDESRNENGFMRIFRHVKGSRKRVTLFSKLVYLEFFEILV
jgi:hypothetical protein